MDLSQHLNFSAFPLKFYSWQMMVLWNKKNLSIKTFGILASVELILELVFFYVNQMCLVHIFDACYMLD